MKIMIKLALLYQHYYLGKSQPPVHLHKGHGTFAVLCKYYHTDVKENELENVSKAGPIP